MTPNELRDRGAALAMQFGSSRPISLHPEEREVSEVPIGAGTALLVTYSEHRSGAAHRSQVVLRIIARTADGGRASLSGRVVIPTGSLPGFAGAIAEAMEMAGGRTNRRSDADKRQGQADTAHDDEPNAA